MDADNFSSGLARLIFGFHQAIKEKRWQSAETYAEDIWQHYNLRGAHLAQELRKLRETQGAFHEQLQLEIKKEKDKYT